MDEHPRRCLYDPLTAFIAHFGDTGRPAAAAALPSTATVEERLARRIVDGDAVGLAGDLDEALRTRAALSIINDVLLAGMKTVGELFGSGQMQLPFVLQSAEVMKHAVAYLEPFMDRVEGTHKGVMVLATVKGDVHDIGKNLVDIILTNNGYRVINLGIKTPIETMLAAVAEHHADALGMSGLLVKSTVIMKENLELMASRGIRIPVVLGGAALTRRYVEEDLRAVYGGELAYAGDAFDGLAFMERIMSHAPVAGTITDAAPVPEPVGPSPARVDALPEEPAADDGVSTDRSGMEAKLAEGLAAEAVAAARADRSGAALESSMALRRSQEQQADTPPVLVRTASERPVYAIRSAVPVDVPVPAPPFYGSRIVDTVRIEKVFEYINEAALFRGQWQVRRGTRGDEEYRRLIEEEIRPVFHRVTMQAKRDGVLRPRVVYGYYPCNADGDELIVYRPADIPEDRAHEPWPRTDYGYGELVEWQRFVFPRQHGDRYLCLADYFRPAATGERDVVAFQAVTVGERASSYCAELFASNRYQEYLYMHGLAVESAEALAEYWHKSVRTELGIHGQDAAELRRLFSQGYQGSRYSFGYPACPSLEDQRQLFTLLRPDRIGLSLTEEWQLVPEQSTTAMIVHHPAAKYFSIR